MAERSEHTVGSQIGDLRIPDRYAGDLAEISDLVEGHPQAGIVLGKIAGLLSFVAKSEVGDTEYHDGGVLSTDRANFGKRYQPDHHKVRTICGAMRDLGHKIVLTSGTFDIIHIGHAEYLEAASRYGDFLVVGVDSDEKVRTKKGSTRPIVTEEERLRMLSHLRCVDLLTLKQSEDAKWQLISIVQPDTLIATEGTYDPDQIKTLESGYVERVVVLPPQATTSTTARLRRMQISQSSALKEKLITVISGKLEAKISESDLAEIRENIDQIFEES